MTSTRQVLEILKAARRFQVGEPSRDFLGTPITVLLLERPMLLAGLLQPPFCERDLQVRTILFLSTSLVYTIKSDGKSLHPFGVGYRSRSIGNIEGIDPRRHQMARKPAVHTVRDPAGGWINRTEGSERGFGRAPTKSDADQLVANQRSGGG